MSFVSTQRADGIWEPAMPLPLYVWWWHQCSCGSRHWTMNGYRRHWRFMHLPDELRARREAAKATEGTVI